FGLRRSILQGFAKGLLQEGQVCPDAAAPQELCQLASLSTAERDGGSRAQTAVEQQRQVASRARSTGLGGRGGAELLRLTLGQRDQLPDYIELYQQRRRMPDRSGRLPLSLASFSLTRFAESGACAGERKEGPERVALET